MRHDGCEITQSRDPREGVEKLIDPVQGLREYRLLPSDLLDMARRNNPNVRLEFDYEWSGPLVLVMTTRRGRLVYRREEREEWYAVFVRAGLLQRAGAP